MYANDEYNLIYHNFLDAYNNILNEIRFFEAVWELINQADSIMDTLFTRKRELDEIIYSNLEDSNEDFLRCIESTSTAIIDKLHNDLMKIDFPMPDSDKTSSILRILRPLRQEFRKLQTKIKKAIADIANEKTKQQSDSELVELKTIYEKHLTEIEKSKGILRYTDICWPSNGTIEQSIQVLMHGIDQTKIRKAVHLHQKFWHPDKFNQRFSTRLHHDDSQKILERVNLISIGLNAQLSK